MLEALDIAFEAIDNDCHEIPPLAQLAKPINNRRIENNTKQPTANVEDDDDDIERYIDDLIKQNPEEEAGDFNTAEDDDEDRENSFEQAERDQESLHIDTHHHEVEHRRPLIDLVEPIYEVIDEMDLVEEEVTENAEEMLAKIKTKPEKARLEKQERVEKEPVEPYYQIPKSSEPYYEVPKPNPVPLYENVDIFLASVNETNKGEMLSPIPAGVTLEPPKEKPPPPPVMSGSEPESSTETDEPEIVEEDPLKRMNSTKRIKKEIRNKRSSFLGIEGNQDDDDELRLSVAPPPDMSAYIQEERRLEKQLFLKTGLYDSSGEYF